MQKQITMIRQLNFSIEYKTTWGQSLGLAYSDSENFQGEINYLSLKTNDGQLWVGDLEYDTSKPLYYKYELLQNGVHSEGPQARKLSFDHLAKMDTKVNIIDQWRSPQNPKNIYLSAAFADVYFQRDDKSKNIKQKGNLTFTLNCSDVPSDKRIGIVGNHPSLGSWATPILMNADAFPLWSATCHIQGFNETIEYKYVLVDTNSSEIIKWENDQNRTVHFSNNTPMIKTDEGFHFGGNWWRGAGLAIPVFSMRTKNGMGIGEFTDLHAMIDLAENMGLKMIQTLPVNDTIANKSWTDSYPYAAISVYALHPLYINIDSITDISTYQWYDEYQTTRSKLNELSVIDFEAVLNEKTKYTQLLFESIGADFIKSSEAKKFIAENSWIKSYGVFCHLRDIYGTPDFNQWKEFNIFSEDILSKFWKKDIPSKEVGYYVFIQYHLDAQLKKARDYGKTKKIVLKGDLPIGIYRFSCDAWTNPELYNMDQQAGAPPDDYAVDGQNWGFPTYNWEEMSKDGFAWWKSRMSTLARYFDALRIDHILGFFRIWSIPMSQSSGTLGLFYPRLPIHIDELRRAGLTDNIERFTKPYIRTHTLNTLFGQRALAIVDTFMDKAFDGAYQFKSSFDDQSKILKAIENELSEFQELKSKIVGLHTEVLLIEEPGSKAMYFNPRITLQTTSSYQELDQHNKWAIDAVYNDYFFVRHNEYWKNQAYWKLPALLKASNMFICGEDLGMIPATVPEVMTNLNIVPLEIQRMPKTFTEFGVCRNYAYHTVCSPSCHDMSTIRGWWEGSESLANSFYRNYMGRYDEVPKNCDSSIVEYILQDHLYSSSMLAIFPIQDLLGIDNHLRLTNAFAEQINEPANPKHYWRYRLHLNIEDISSNKDFCNRIKQMVENSGR